MRLALHLQEVTEVITFAQLYTVYKGYRRRRWLRSWLTLEQRVNFGMYHTLMRKLEADAQGDFVGFMKMVPRMFLMRLKPRLTKQTTNFRRPLQPGLKLPITLCHIATGESYHSLRLNFHVPHNTIPLLVKEVCQQIIEQYEAEVISRPRSPEEWKALAQRFSNNTQFHHCVAVLDEKHIAITAPRKSGSVYHNYTVFFSISLLALVDADY